MVDCGTLTVEPAFDASLVEATGCVNLPTGDVHPGESITVGVTVDNPNDDPANVDVTVFTPAQQLGRRDDVDIPANGSREVDVTITAPEVGSHSVDAEAEDVGVGSPVGATPRRADGGSTLGRTRRRCPTC